MKCKTSLESCSCQSALGSTTAVTSSAAASVTTKGRKISEVIDKNQCCICYRSFADDEMKEKKLVYSGWNAFVLGGFVKNVLITT